MSYNTRSQKLDASASIFNGARCKSYSWSQSHTDLEIRIKLAEAHKYEDVNVVVSKRSICVEVAECDSRQHRGDIVSSIVTLMEGKFEHPVDKESAFWLIENEEPSIVVYVDKAEDMWWKHLLENEQVAETGPKNYSVPMDLLDDSSRMIIDKLVNEQRNKLLSRDDQDSPA